MARLPLIAQTVRRKRIGIVVTIWLEICNIVSWFILTLGAIDSLHTYRPRIRSYILDFYAKRDYVKMLYMLVTRPVLNKLGLIKLPFLNYVRCYKR